MDHPALNFQAAAGEVADVVGLDEAYDAAEGGLRLRKGACL